MSMPIIPSSVDAHGQAKCLPRLQPIGYLLLVNEAKKANFGRLVVKCRKWRIFHAERHELKCLCLLPLVDLGQLLTPPIPPTPGIGACL
jgi:hypothetical protein